MSGSIDHTTDDLRRALLGNVYDVCGDVFTHYHDHGFPINPRDWYRDYNLGGRTPCFNECGYSDHTYETGHSKLLETVVNMAVELGVEVCVNNKVTSLVHDGAIVTGVRVEDKQRVYTVNAKKVILATGGFQQNQELMEKYNSSFAQTIPFAAAGCTGDAITMTEELDVPVVGAGGAAGWPALSPAVGWYGPIADLARTGQLVMDKDGQNLGSGALDYDTFCNLTDCTAYAFYDYASMHRDRCVDGVKAGLIKQYATTEEIAEDLGIDQIAIDTAFGTAGLATPPYYCATTYPCDIITFPGLKVDEFCRVQNASGETIKNLYAAGAVAFGNLFEDTADDPGMGNWVGTFSSAMIVNCMGAVAASDAAASIA